MIAFALAHSDMTLVLGVLLLGLVSWVVPHCVALPVDERILYADDTAASRHDRPQYDVSQIEDDGEDMLDGFGARFPPANFPLDNIQLANIFMQSTGLPEPEFINQQFVEVRRKKRSNYDNYHKHLVEIAPILHKKNNEGKTPLAIILAAPDLIDKNRNIRKKTRNKRRKIAKENINNDESDEINQKKKKVNQKTDREPIFLNISPGFKNGKKKTVIVSSEENSDVYRSSVESSLEHQAKVANALANALQKYSNYKLRHETVDESRENDKKIVISEKQNIEPLLIAGDNWYHENKKFTSAKNHEHSHNNSSKDSKLQVSKENNELDKEATLKGFRDITRKEGWDEITSKEGWDDIKKIIITEERDSEGSHEIKIKGSKEIPDKHEKALKKSNESKVSRELTTKHLSHNDEKKYFEESKETQNLIGDNHHNVNNEIIFKETKPTENEENNKKILHNEELYLELAKEIENKGSGKKNKQSIENEKSKQISDEMYLQDNGQDFIIVTPLTHPENDFVRSKQLSSKETFINVSTYVSPLEINENISNSFENSSQPLTYIDIIDRDQPTLDQEISKQDDIQNNTELDKIKHEKQLDAILIKKEGSADESLINKSKPEIHSMYVNKNSLITPSSKENMSNILKENILELLQDISNVEDILHDDNKNKTFRSLNKDHKSNIPIGEDIIEESNNKNEDKKVEAKISSENSSNYKSQKLDKRESDSAEESLSIQSSEDSYLSNESGKISKNAKHSVSDSEENELRDGDAISRKEVHLIAIDEFPKQNLNTLRNNMYDFGSLYNTIEGQKTDKENEMQEKIASLDFNKNKIQEKVASLDFNKLGQNNSKDSGLKTYNLSFIFSK